MELTVVTPRELVKLPRGIRCELWLHPSVMGYKALFTAVGGEWGWSGRLNLTDDELAAVIRNPGTAVWLLKIDGIAAGFFELDMATPGEVEIVYLGLVHDLIGCGFGRVIISLAVEKALALKPRKVWLHTCEYDHPGAVAAYEKAGFKVVKDEIIEDFYPVTFSNKVR